MSDLFPNFKISCLTGVPNQLSNNEWGCKLDIGLKGEKNEVVKITSKNGDSWYVALKQKEGLSGESELWSIRVLNIKQAQLLIKRNSKKHKK